MAYVWVKICPICGREYEISNWEQITCSRECSRIYIKRVKWGLMEKLDPDKPYKKTIKVEKPEEEIVEEPKTSYEAVSAKNKSLFDIAKEAYDHGMTYGQYVGKQIIQEERNKKKQPKNKGDKK